MPAEHHLKKPVPNSSEGLLNHSDSWNTLVIVLITLLINTWWLIIILIWYRINLFSFFFLLKGEAGGKFREASFYLLLYSSCLLAWNTTICFGENQSNHRYFIWLLSAVSFFAVCLFPWKQKSLLSLNIQAAHEMLQRSDSLPCIIGHVYIQLLNSKLAEC